MTLRLYDTLTKQKQSLEDLPGFDRNNVRMYVCGPTVYDFAHIGNARPVIVFDVLFRLLRHLYGAEHVTYVRNITDIDDKINARAAEVAAAKGVSVEAARVEITQATAKQFEEDVTALGCLKPTHTPRATEYVARMVEMIETLVRTGHAYPAEGHVLFDISSKSDYGKLARRSLDEMLAGARVEVAPYKKNPMDFVLWKPSDDATPGWPSPWGRGRPGWHIECSAMGEALLGETFDIHGGGIDLMFPHHENEIAQSESAHLGHPLARIWMHNGFLQVEGEKMAKSLGNFVTIRDLLETHNFGNARWDGRVLRMAMLMTSYRQPIDWTAEKLYDANSALTTFALDVDNDAAVGGSVYPPLLDALLDDLNTPQVITELFALHKMIVRAKDRQTQDEHIKMLYASLTLLGFDDLSGFKNGAHVHFEHVITNDEINQAILRRNAARKAKDFKESDRIRDELLAKGIVLKDGPTGTTWEVKR
jgi:cysteinyl-tRNA synthetase